MWSSSFKILLILFKLQFIFPCVFFPFGHSQPVYIWVFEVELIIYLLLLMFSYPSRIFVSIVLSLTHTRFTLALPCPDISFGSIPASSWAVLGHRLISIKSPFDLGLSGAAAATPVQSLWYGGLLKIGFKTGFNFRGLVCAAQGWPAWGLLPFQLRAGVLIGPYVRDADWWKARLQVVAKKTTWFNHRITPLNGNKKIW